MQRLRFFPLLLLCSGLACKASGAARLEGHWRGQRAEGVASEVQASANLFATQMEIQVKGEAIVVTLGSERHYGKFKVKREDKASLSIVTDTDGPDDVQTFTFLDDRTLKWSVLNGQTITFRRE